MAEAIICEYQVEIAPTVFFGSNSDSWQQIAGQVAPLDQRSQ